MVQGQHSTPSTATGGKPAVFHPVVRQAQRSGWRADEAGATSDASGGARLRTVRPVAGDPSDWRCEPDQLAALAESWPRLRWQDNDPGLLMVNVRPGRRRIEPAARPGARRREVASPRRTIALPPDVLRLLIEHQEAQDREREAAGQLWEEHGFVFAGRTGRPIDPRADNREWSELLEEAGVREARLHDARHTAATVLLVLGVPQRAVMGLMVANQHHDDPLPAPYAGPPARHRGTRRRGALGH